MSELISEIDAFIAWKNGQEVEIYDESMCWHPLYRDHGLCVFDSNGRVKFRLKPRTVTINGIEVPTPFKPKDGELIFVLDNCAKEGFTSFIFDGDFYSINFGAWRTEDEVKQVVAALRSVFNVEK